MPSISFDRLPQLLSSRKPVPGIVLLGSDAYLRDLCRKQIIDACVPPAARDWALDRFTGDAAGWNAALQRALNMPMLAPRQVIIIEDASLIERLGEKSRDAIVDSLSAYLESPAPFTLLLIEAADLDGRLRFFKLLSDKATIVPLEITSGSAAAFAAQMAHELGVAIDRDAASLLADILNGQPGRIRIELEKLAAYVQGRNRIAHADVEALVVAARKNTVWQLADLLAARDRRTALQFLENLLREGEAAPMIIGALAFRYRKLIEARSLPPNTPGYRAASQLGMNSRDAESAVRSAHRASKKSLLDGLLALAEADSALKSSNPDPRAYLEFLITRLASA
jgi:DNA polymerase III subunit delta